MTNPLAARMAKYTEPTGAGSTAGRLSFVSGDLFTTDAEALVNTVNCVGAMGRGIALGVKNRWPATYDAYRRACGSGLACDGTRDPRYGILREQQAPPCCCRDDERQGRACHIHHVKPGVATLHRVGPPARGFRSSVKYVIDVPTKRHWTEKSRLADVTAGLASLAELLRTQNITSVAVPPLGCGNGGLDWAVVRPYVVAAFSATGCDVRIHAPPGV